MNTQSAQPIPSNSQHPDQQGYEMLDNPDQALTAINADQLADIAELLDIIDGFLRHAGIANRLADYLHTTGLDHPQPPRWAGYNANLLIDQVSFTAHALRATPPRTATVSTRHR
jgi:hypothetical protein